MGTRTTDVPNSNDSGEFDEAWRRADTRLRTLVEVVYGLAGLSRLGERPVPVDRFAAYLGTSADQARTEVEQLSGALFSAVLRDGLITLELDRPAALRRRHLTIGARRIAMSGCAPDLFQLAAVLDTPFLVEDTCRTTGASIRIAFAPPDRRSDLIDAVDPDGTVVALDPRLLGQTSTMTPEQIDANLCAQMPFFADTDAARTWLADHPDGVAVPVRDMAGLELVGYVRDVLRPRVLAHLC